METPPTFNFYNSLYNFSTVKKDSKKLVKLNGFKVKHTHHQIPSTYLSEKVVKFFQTSKSVNSIRTGFVPFKNERDSLNRLIDSQKTSRYKNQLSSISSASKLKETHNEYVKPRLSIILDNDFNPSSFLGSYSILFKRRPLIRTKKNQLLPISKINDVSQYLI